MTSQQYQDPDNSNNPINWSFDHADFGYALQSGLQSFSADEKQLISVLNLGLLEYVSYIHELDSEGLNNLENYSDSNVQTYLDNYNSALININPDIIDPLVKQKIVELIDLTIEKGTSEDLRKLTHYFDTFECLNVRYSVLTDTIEKRLVQELDLGLNSFAEFTELPFISQQRYGNNFSQELKSKVRREILEYLKNDTFSEYYDSSDGYESLARGSDEVVYELLSNVINYFDLADLTETNEYKKHVALTVYTRLEAADIDFRDIADFLKVLPRQSNDLRTPSISLKHEFLENGYSHSDISGLIRKVTDSIRNELEYPSLDYAKLPSLVSSIKFLRSQQLLIFGEIKKSAGQAIKNIVTSSNRNIHQSAQIESELIESEDYLRRMVSVTPLIKLIENDVKLSRNFYHNNEIWVRINEFEKIANEIFDEYSDMLSGKGSERSQSLHIAKSVKDLFSEINSLFLICFKPERPDPMAPVQKTSERSPRLPAWYKKFADLDLVSSGIFDDDAYPPIMSYRGFAQDISVASWRKQFREVIGELKRVKYNEQFTVRAEDDQIEAKLENLYKNINYVSELRGYYREVNSSILLYADFSSDPKLAEKLYTQACVFSIRAFGQYSQEVSESMGRFSKFLALNDETYEPSRFAESLSRKIERYVSDNYSNEALEKSILRSYKSEMFSRLFSVPRDYLETILRLREHSNLD